MWWLRSGVVSGGAGRAASGVAAGGAPFGRAGQQSDGACGRVFGSWALMGFAEVMWLPYGMQGLAPQLVTRPQIGVVFGWCSVAPRHVPLAEASGPAFPAPGDVG